MVVGEGETFPVLHNYSFVKLFYVSRPPGCCHEIPVSPSKRLGDKCGKGLYVSGDRMLYFIHREEKCETLHELRLLSWIHDPKPYKHGRKTRR